MELYLRVGGTGTMEFHRIEIMCHNFVLMKLVLAAVSKRYGYGLWERTKMAAGFADNAG